jgi:hypothetical protein
VPFCSKLELASEILNLFFIPESFFSFGLWISVHAFDFLSLVSLFASVLETAPSRGKLVEKDGHRIPKRDKRKRGTENERRKGA